MSETMNMTAEELLRQETITQAGAAKRFGVSDRTIRRWEAAEMITATRVRGLKLYGLEQLKSLVGLRDGADAKYVSKRVRESGVKINPDDETKNQIRTAAVSNGHESDRCGHRSRRASGRAA